MRSDKWKSTLFLTMGFAFFAFCFSLLTITAEPESADEMCALMGMMIMCGGMSAGAFAAFFIAGR